MLQQLLSRNEDLKRLRDEGYEVEVKGGYLLVHHIPYVNHEKLIKYGSLVCELTLNNNSQTARPSTHIMYFIGDHPCNKDGTAIAEVTHSSQTQNFGQGIIVNHSFSNKPPEGYPDYHQKVTRYEEIISAPAKSLDPSIKSRTFKLIPDDAEESVFHYFDTNSSRANVAHLNTKFKGQKIGIVGLGGTGVYILDQVAKTHVQWIHLFDGDDLHQHNAFRSPGAVSTKVLDRGYKKAMYYAKVYSRMRKNIKANCLYINEVNLHLLKEMSYVFICVDDDDARKLIMQYLLREGISFIDVGLGVNRVDDFLIGTLRVTTATHEKNDHLVDRVSFGGKNDYKDNIQIADLNALNALLAVVKWKKLTGFYQDLEGEHHTTYSINVAQLISEERSEEQKNIA